MPTNNTSINSVLVLDTSGSMTYSGYVDITKIDSKAFVSCAEENSRIAVCNFDVDGRTPLPLTVVDSGDTVITEASNIIQNLSFMGGCTNIGSGLQQGIAQVNNVTDPRGLVLLSDGRQNCGTNPLDVPPPPYPIFSCAMGPNSDQLLMQQIAAMTPNGQYSYAPKVVDMMKIYNQIRAMPPITQGIANNLSNIIPDYWELVPAAVSSGNREAQFVITWTNTNLSYTSGNPSSTKLSITLVDPDNITLSDNPKIIGSGYVVFDIPNPKVGTWQTQILYGSAIEALPVTVGVFEFHNDANKAIELQVEAPKTVKKGKPISITAKVIHQGEEIADFSAYTEIIHPKISIENAIKYYKNQLETISPAEEDIGKGMSLEQARLKALYKKLLPQIDILPSKTYVKHLIPQKGNFVTGKITDTHEAGTYNIHVRVKGHSHVTDSPFERNHLVSVLIQ